MNWNDFPFGQESHPGFDFIEDTAGTLSTSQLEIVFFSGMCIYHIEKKRFHLGTNKSTKF